ncbi:MAG: hypothetical protein C0424_01415 [Sphingobacteriaceae bacterium]|nr:hypothetical protein [Sphingobacteriaceae bacterium]
MFRAFLLSVGLWIGAFFAHGQSPIVFHRGWVIGNYTTAPFYFAPSQAWQSTEDTLSYKNNRGLQLGLNWGARINLYELNSLQSVSLHLDLVGTGFISNGFIRNDRLPDLGLALQIPVVVNYNWGHMATRESSAERGFAVGLGVEINRVFSLLEASSFYEVANQRGFAQTAAASFVQPVLNLGYRYWNRKDRPREINLQLGFGKMYRFEHGNSFRPNLRISMHKYINY